MFWRYARDRSVVARSIKTAGLVGTILVVINHGDVLFAGELAQQMDATRVWKIVLDVLRALLCRDICSGNGIEVFVESWRAGVVVLQARWFVAFVFALGTAAAAAQDVEEEVLVVGDRSLSSRAGTAAAVGTVDREALELIRHTHVSESLARVPGVWISRGSGQEHLTAIRSPVLTGAGACGEFLFMEDGVPIRPTGFCNVNNLFELNSEQAERIEVWRGPSSAVLGGNGLRGAINVHQRAAGAHTVQPGRGAVWLRAGAPFGASDGWRFRNRCIAGRHAYGRLPQSDRL